MMQNFRVTAPTFFWVIKGKPTGGGGGDYLPPPRLGLTNKPKPKKNKRFSQKTLTIHPICSNCDAFDKKLKIYILLVCHNQHILVAVPILNISNLLSTCDKNDKLMCSDFF